MLDRKYYKFKTALYVCSSSGVFNSLPIKSRLYLESGPPYIAIKTVSYIHTIKHTQPENNVLYTQWLRGEIYKPILKARSIKIK